MAITVTDLGGTTSTTGSTVTITGVTAAVGDLICVISCENTNTTVLNVPTDTGSNTYNSTGVMHPNGATANGIGTIFWSVLTSALSSGTITYTRVGSNGAAVSIAALLAHSPTGWKASPLDSGFTNTANGSSTTPSVTSSAAPSVNPEFLVAGVLTHTTEASFTQDTGNGWASPFVLKSVSSTAVLGGNQTAAQTASTVTYAPTLPTTATWSTRVLGFLPVPPLPTNNLLVYQAIKRASYW